MRVLWYWIPPILLFSGWLNLDRGSISSLIYKTVFHGLIILGFVMLCDQTYLSIKAREGGRTLMLIVATIFAIGTLKAGYFFFEMVAICPAVDQGPNFVTNIFTGECKFGAYGRCDEGHRVWYLKRGCDISFEEKKAIAGETKDYQEGADLCKELCERGIDKYCNAIIGYAGFTCGDLYQCPGSPC